MIKVNNSLNIPKYCWQHLQTWGGQPFWVLWDLRDRHHQGLWERLAAQQCSIFLGYTHTPKEAMAIWHAGSLEAVATYRGLIRELASSRGMHGPSADGAALRGVAKLPPHSHHNSSQNHSQAKGDASHHNHVSTKGRVPDRRSGRGWRRCRQHWGWKGRMLCLKLISRNRESWKRKKVDEETDPHSPPVSRRTVPSPCQCTASLRHLRAANTRARVPSPPRHSSHCTRSTAATGPMTLQKKKNKGYFLIADKTIESLQYKPVIKPVEA